jgi:fumarylpyruvate hydrolase
MDDWKYDVLMMREKNLKHQVVTFFFRMIFHMTIQYPPMTKFLHYEAELIVAIGKEAFQLNQLESATDCIFGYSIGSDLTRRDLQNEAKTLKRPWSTSKSFDHSAPSGPIVMKQEVEDDALLPWNANISLSVNGTLKQESSIDKMIWSIPEMICHLSNYFRLKPGDLIMTGTPAGVDNLNIGDEVVVECGNLPPCRFTIGQKETVSQTL